MAPYTAVDSFHQVVEDADESFLLDNEALHSICFRTSTGAAMPGSIPCLRIPDRTNRDRRQVVIHVIHFFRFHSVIATFAPRTSRGPQQCRGLTVSELTPHMFKVAGMVCASEPRQRTGLPMIKDAIEQTVYMKVASFLEAEALGWHIRHVQVNDATSSSTSALPSGLVEGFSALSFPHVDNGAYRWEIQCSPAELRAAVHDFASNWDSSNSAPLPAMPLSFDMLEPTPFPTPVPTFMPTPFLTSLPETYSDVVGVVAQLLILLDPKCCCCKPVPRYVEL